MQCAEQCVRFGLTLGGSEAECGDGLEDVARAVVGGKEKGGKRCSSAFVAESRGETEEAESFGDISLTDKERFGGLDEIIEDWRAG